MSDAGENAVQWPRPLPNVLSGMTERATLVRFTLKQLSYFVAAGETNSITLASERVHISQPSISSAVSQLEALFGIQLFFRHHAQGLSLTPAGERILVAARDLLRQAQALHGLAHEITSTVAGPLRIGAFRTFAPLLLPDLCAEFAAAYPQVTLEMVEDDEAELVAMVRKAELDIALSYEQAGADLLFEPLATMPTYVLLSDRHPLSGRASIPLRELADEPFILLDLPVSKEYFQSLFARAGVPLNVAARSGQPETVRSYVGCGLGFSLLTARPRNMSALNGHGLAYVPLADDFPPMKLGMISARNIAKTPAIVAFEDHCRRNVTTAAIPGMTTW